MEYSKKSAITEVTILMDCRSKFSFFSCGRASRQVALFTRTAGGSQKVRASTKVHSICWTKTIAIFPFSRKLRGSLMQPVIG
jgi:hypothetical protein